MSSVAVLGAGNMGTALAQLLATNGQTVRLWSIEGDVLEEVRDHHRNSKYLEEVRLHDSIAACWRLEEALAGAWLAIISVPSYIVRIVANDAAPYLQEGQVVLNVAKGLEESSGPSTDSGQALRMSEVLAAVLPASLHGGIACMGGPAIAAELARGAPTAVVVAARNQGIARSVQSALQNDYFKVETTTDVVGVELGATLKNAYAIALGMCDGLGHGTNTKAFIASLALAEMAALLVALGGKARTAYGLAGLGDLLTTGYSAHSRNRTLGEKLCTDPEWQEFVRTHTVEGIAACRSARDLAGRCRVQTPLLDAIHGALFGEEPPAEAIRRFLREFSYG